MDFLSVAGAVFAEALADWEEEVVPHDFYEVFLEGLRLPLDSARLATLTRADYESLNQAACEYFEVNAFPANTLPLVVAAILRRWPAERT